MRALAVTSAQRVLLQACLALGDVKEAAGVDGGNVDDQNAEQEQNAEQQQENGEDQNGDDGNAKEQQNGRSNN